MNLRHSRLGLGLTLLLTALLGACSSGAADETSERETVPGTAPEPKPQPMNPATDPAAPMEPGAQQGFQLLQSDVVRQDPDVPATTEATLTQGNRAFALDMYAQLKAQAKGNLFFSPHSISTALAMAYAGANGQTKTEMGAAMHFDLPDEELHAGFNHLARALDERQIPATEETQGLQLEVQNDIWASDAMRPLQSYIDGLALNYSAPVKLVDFGDPDGARITINDEIERLTHGTIADLIPPQGINQLTRMVLTNAVYFKAPWATPFEKAATQSAPFTTSDGEAQTAEMMHAVVGVPYVANDDLQAVWLPYLGREIGLWVLLPKTGRFAEVEAALDATVLGELTSSAVVGLVDLKLPKLSMRSSFGLSAPLQALGMKAAFELGRAQFGEIGLGDIYIQDVVHQAFIDLDEAGTEASAATAVIFGGDSAPPEPEIEFNADHPFILLLEDRATQTILFAGRYLGPDATDE